MADTIDGPPMGFDSQALARHWNSSGFTQCKLKPPEFLELVRSALRSGAQLKEKTQRRRKRGSPQIHGFVLVLRNEIEHFLRHDGTPAQRWVKIIFWKPDQFDSEDRKLHEGLEYVLVSMRADVDQLPRHVSTSHEHGDARMRTTQYARA